jgi:hypothetical protein
MDEKLKFQPVRNSLLLDKFESKYNVTSVFVEMVHEKFFIVSMSLAFMTNFIVSLSDR